MQGDIVGQAAASQANLGVAVWQLLATRGGFTPNLKGAFALKPCRAASVWLLELRFFPKRYHRNDDTLCFSAAAAAQADTLRQCQGSWGAAQSSHARTLTALRRSEPTWMHQAARCWIRAHPIPGQMLRSRNPSYRGCRPLTVGDRSSRSGMPVQGSCVHAVGAAVIMCVHGCRVPDDGSAFAQAAFPCRPAGNSLDTQRPCSRKALCKPGGGLLVAICMHGSLCGVTN